LVTTTIRAEQTWDLKEIYKDEAAFNKAKQELRDSFPSLDSHKGQLSESAATLAAALEESTEAYKKLALLRTYTNLKSDLDTRVAKYQAMRQEIDLLATELSRILSYMRPEILEIDEDTIDGFIQQEPRLEPHSFYLRDLMRQRRHVLGSAEERIMAEAGLITRSGPALYRTLYNAEMPRPTATLEDGEKINLTPVNFQKQRASQNRKDRQTIFPAYYGAYSDFKETLAQNLYSAVKSHMFRARTRGYDSCLAASLDGDNVPASVYHNLIEQVHERLPLLHRYLKLRARALGLERLEYSDLYCPLSVSAPSQFSPDEARKLVEKTLTPLGEEYAKELQAAFTNNWIDWHPSDGKRAGAYASGWAYDYHPFVLINYSGDYESVSTLSHEIGHAMHSHFSNREQPFAMAIYSIFVAEVASTLNESLLAQRLIETAPTEQESLFYLASHLDAVRGTLFRQTMFAEFELSIHEKAESGEALTGERLNEIYLGLLRKYHGHDDGVMNISEDCAIEWAAVPHFYYDFYVYQYSTGLIAATALAEALTSSEKATQSRYAGFLSAGGSDYPLELLRAAGVDLESAKPYDATFTALERLLDRLEGLLGTIESK
jgi:oligoendopeptidase F